MDVRKYLEQDTMPSHFSTRQKREIILKALSYQLVHRALFRKHHTKVLLRCMEVHDSKKLLRDLHNGLAGGHFAGNTTTHKVMRAWFYWPTLLRYAHSYAYKCPICQRWNNINKKSATPRQPIAVEEPFQQWGFDIIREIFLHSLKKHSYILTATDYFMRWTE